MTDTIISRFNVPAVDVGSGVSGTVTLKATAFAVPHELLTLAGGAEANALAAEASEQAAGLSEQAASLSEGVATQKASDASGSAFAAQSSEDASSNSATASQASAVDAQSSEDDSAASALAASTSEINASNSETASALSESNASNSAGAASTSEDNASASETAAGNSASASSTSADNSAGSATSSQNAETGAIAARNATESLLDQFGDRYLGSKSSDPTTDNDGAALVDGSVYWNSTDSVLKFYSGTAWVAPEDVASTAASNAQASENAAATSEGNASTSETNAGNSASAASISEGNAATSETNAGNSASAASTSASNASTSETNAGNSAGAAAISETNAGNSEQAAATSESNAATAASDAVSDHVALPDPHSQYTTAAEVNAAFNQYGVGAAGTNLANADNAVLGSNNTTGFADNTVAVSGNYPDVGIGSGPVWWNLVTYGIHNRTTQVATELFGQGGRPKGETFTRIKHDTWEPWVQNIFASDANFTTMPQVGGDPIVESGSNADGEWTRWADGTQITHLISGTLTASDEVSSGSGLYSSVISTATFPRAFDVIPVSALGVRGTSGAGLSGVVGWASARDGTGAVNTTTAVEVGFTSPGQNATALVWVVSVGRWQ